VTVVSPVAGRDRLAVADVVGFFVNLVALRTDLAGDPSFREALQRVSAVVREGLRHQDLPFEQVLSALGADRSIARPPISPMAFALEQAIAPSIDLPDLEVTPLPLATTTSKTDLALILREHERGIAARVEYDCELYGAGAVDDLLHGFVAGLERASAVRRRGFRTSCPWRFWPGRRRCRRRSGIVSSPKRHGRRRP
jgi:non-ribosomal peptide synthetase component F